VCVEECGEPNKEWSRCLSSCNVTYVFLRGVVPLNENLDESAGAWLLHADARLEKYCQKKGTKQAKITGNSGLIELNLLCLVCFEQVPRRHPGR
jgi:hypothetical protein